VTAAPEPPDLETAMPPAGPSTDDRAFAVATMVAPGHRDGEFAATVSPQWTVGRRPNGGYLLALAARAAVAGAHGVHPHPLAATATYLRPPETGPVVLRTEVLRAGRTATQVRVVMEQNGTGCVDAVMILGRLDPAAEPRWADAHPPDLPPVNDCPRLPPNPPGSVGRVTVLESTEVRLDPAVLGFASGRPSGRAELRGWVRLADHSPTDPFSILYLLDVLPPATFEIGSSGWVPTLQLTTYVRSLPSSGYLRIRQRATLVQDGYVDEECSLWDERGRLVGQATQLARVRFSDEQSERLA
jgi:acyl-CoA thioesterase